MQKLAVFSLLMMTFLSLKSFGALVTVSPDENYTALKQVSDAMPKVITPKQITNVPLFCRVNGLRDHDQTWGEMDPVHSHLNAWMGNLCPSLDTRQKIYEAAFTLQADFAGRYRFGAQTSLEELITNVKPMTADQIQSCNSDIESLKNNVMVQQEEDQKATLTQSMYLCKDVTLLHVGACSSSLGKLADITKPYGDINLVEIWREVLEDPNYIQGMKEVALENIGMIKDEKIPTTRLFDNLNKAFYSILKDKKQAVDHTFKVLGVLSSDAGNSFDYLPCDVPDNVRAIILALSVSDNVLDRMTAQKGFLYTYPKEVDSLCDYGKGYHFWMTAFLAHEAAEDTGNVVAAASAAFTMNKGYQFMKQNGGRDRTAAFTRDSFSDYNNNMRLDLTQAAAGAWFGATSVKSLGSKTLSRAQFETGLRKVFDGSTNNPPQTDFSFPETSDIQKMLTTYSKWKSIINPDAAFNYYQKELGQ